MSRADFLYRSLKCSSVKSLFLSKPAARHVAIDLPGDKSITHRALMLAAIADGVTKIDNPNRGLDVAATIGALRNLGVHVRTNSAGVLVAGSDRLRDPRRTIDCGNSGTTMRLLAGLLAGRVNAILDGDASLRRRPMERVVLPLRAMGASLSSSRGGHPPITLHRGAGPLRALDYRMPVASAQIKSALLLAALRAGGPSEIHEPARTRDHTEIMLKSMGAKITTRGRSIRISPSQLRPLRRTRVPGDFSAAVYLLCAAAVVPGSELTLRSVGINPTRTAALEVMTAMGARLRITRRRSWSGEAVADISIKGGAPLRGIAIPASKVPNLIDEIPALCALAAMARGSFSIRKAAELRVKESDRIQTTVDLLRNFGAQARPLEDGIVVTGGQALRAPRSVSTRGDHRIGLTAAILSAAAGSSLVIRDAPCVATSFPDFPRVWRAAFGTTPKRKL